MSEGLGRTLTAGFPPGMTLDSLDHLRKLACIHCGNITDWWPGRDDAHCVECWDTKDAHGCRYQKQFSYYGRRLTPEERTR